MAIRVGRETPSEAMTGIADDLIGPQRLQIPHDAGPHHLGVARPPEHLSEPAHLHRERIGDVPVEQAAKAAQRAAQLPGGHPCLVDRVGLVTTHVALESLHGPDLAPEIAHQDLPRRQGSPMRGTLGTLQPERAGDLGAA